MPRKSTEAQSRPKEKEVSASPKKETRKHWRDAHYGLFWPITLIVIGFIWLARNLGWLGPHFPWLPLALIALGVYLLCFRTGRVYKPHNKKKSTE